MRVKYYFENLMVEEICLAYFDYLKLGESSKEATKHMIEDYWEILSEDSFLPIMLWLSLGYYQWELGRLISPVKEKAKQAYIELMNQLDSFYSLDLYENYIDCKYAPTTTHEQMLKQADIMVESLDRPMGPEKKLRSQSFFKKIDKLVDHGVYAYKIACDIIHQKGKDCYVYFVVDLSQRDGCIAVSNEIPIYVFNCYSVDEVFPLKHFENLPILKTTYHKKYKTIYENDQLSSYKRYSLWFLYAHKPSIGYRKLTFLGKMDELYLPHEEIKIRKSKERYRISSIQFEDFDISIDSLLRTADSRYNSCAYDKLIENIDILDYDFTKL